MRDKDDQAPQYAYWLPEQAIRDLEMEKQLYGNETHTQRARRLIQESADLAAMSIKYLATYSGREEIRLAASKYLLEHGIGAPTKNNELPSTKHAWESIHEAVLVDAKDVQKSAKE